MFVLVGGGDWGRWFFFFCLIVRFCERAAMLFYAG